jgi:hypothetical protein
MRLSDSSDNSDKKTHTIPAPVFTRGFLSIFLSDLSDCQKPPRIFPFSVGCITLKRSLLTIRFAPSPVPGRRSWLADLFRGAESGLSHTVSDKQPSDLSDLSERSGRILSETTATLLRTHSERPGSLKQLYTVINLTLVDSTGPFQKRSHECNRFLLQTKDLRASVFLSQKRTFLLRSDHGSSDKADKGSAVRTRFDEGQRAGQRKPAPTASRLRGFSGLDDRGRIHRRSDRKEQRPGGVQALVFRCSKATLRNRAVLGARSLLTRGNAADAEVSRTLDQLRSELAFVHSTVARLDRTVPRFGNCDHVGSRETGADSHQRTHRCGLGTRSKGGPGRWTSETGTRPRCSSRNARERCNIGGDLQRILDQQDFSYATCARSIVVSRSLTLRESPWTLDRTAHGLFRFSQHLNPAATPCSRLPAASRGVLCRA